jgi:hypothetical protein
VHELEEPFSLEDPASGGTIGTATFVDAGHCPGSAMVVFQIDDKFFVNTGDFRWHDALRDSPTLQRIASARCQLLCLDVSWANAPFITFPTKGESIAMLLGLIDRYCSVQRFFIHSHCLGDEELLTAIASRREKLLFTDKCRYNEVKIADPYFCESSCTLLEDYVMCPDDYRFIVVGRSTAWRVDQRLKNVDGIEVSCSTLWWAKQGAIHDLYQPVHDPITGIHHVFWAMHSSPEEIQIFKKFMNAQDVHPICQSIIDNGDIDTGTARRLIVFPDSELAPAPRPEPEESQESCRRAWADSLERFFHEPGPIANDTLAQFHEHSLLPDSLPSSSSAPRQVLRCPTRTTEIDGDSACSTTEAESDDERPIFESCMKRPKR